MRRHMTSFTSYGVTMGSGGYDPLGMNDAARYGTYATFNLAYQGTPRLGYESEDYAIGYKGDYMYPNPRSAHIQQDMINKGKTLASLMKDSPVFLGLNLNSERHQGSHGLAPFDFSPAEIKRAEKFGLDLNRWKPSGKYANNLLCLTGLYLYFQYITHYVRLPLQHRAYQFW